MEKHDYKRWIFSAVAFFSLIAVWEVGMWDVESRITHKKC